MKLFLIIYAGTHLGGAIGPLPYDMKECEVRRNELRSSQAKAIASGIHVREGRKLTADELAKIGALRFECEYRGQRPSVPA